MMVVACSSIHGSSAPPTLGQRCAASCTAPTSTDNPCAGQPTPAGCASSCESTLTGKSDECVSCYLGYAGWRGTSCSCSKPGGLVDVSCSECTYRAGSKSCDTELINKCSSGGSCAGWVPLALDDQVCATKCGVAPNLALYRCQNACLPPSDRDNACNGATNDQQKACIDLCTSRIGGKTDDCVACYLAHASWVADGSQCRGFEEMKLDECTSVCGM